MWVPAANVTSVLQVSSTTTPCLAIRRRYKIFSDSTFSGWNRVILGRGSGCTGGPAAILRPVTALGDSGSRRSPRTAQDEGIQNVAPGEQSTRRCSGRLCSAKQGVMNERRVSPGCATAERERSAVANRPFRLFILMESRVLGSTVPVM